MESPKPLDELGATTRRRLFVNRIEGPALVYEEDNLAGRADSEILASPPCSLDGVRELLLQINKHRRGEPVPYETTYERRVIQ